MATDRPLTTKQKMFVSAYLANNYNATQAAITAGYKTKPNVMGSENLAKSNIQAAIAEKLKSLTTKHGIDQNAIIAEFKEMADARIERPWGEDKMRVTAHNKITALTKLAEICRLIQQHEPGQQAQQVVVNIMADGKPIAADIIDDDNRSKTDPQAD